MEGWRAPNPMMICLSLRECVDKILEICSEQEKGDLLDVCKEYNLYKHNPRVGCITKVSEALQAVLSSSERVPKYKAPKRSNVGA